MNRVTMVCVEPGMVSLCSNFRLFYSAFALYNGVDFTIVKTCREAERSCTGTSGQSLRAMPWVGQRLEKCQMSKSKRPMVDALRAAIYYDAGAGCCSMHVITGRRGEIEENGRRWESGVSGAITFSGAVLPDGASRFRIGNIRPRHRRTLHVQ